MTYRRLLSAIAIASVILPAAAANATLSQTCFYTTPLVSGASDPTIPWFASGSTVDIYYSTYYGGSAATDKRPWVAMGLSQAEFEQVAIKAVGVWNEQSGAKIRLRYRGGTNTYSENCAPGAICKVFILGDQVTCHPTYTAEAFIGLNSAHKFESGTIKFYQQNMDGQPCHVIPWKVTTDGLGVDSVRTLIHELGHVVFAMAHLDATRPECPDKDASNNYYKSIMQVNGPFLYDKRNLKAWDKEVVQLRYGTRSSSAVMKKSVLSGTTWVTRNVTGTSVTRPLYRGASMTQQLPTRVFGWLDGNGVVQNYGGGYQTAARYGAGIWDDVWLGGPGYGTSEPVAIASQTDAYGAPLVLYAFKKFSPGFEYTSDQNQICWRITSDLGASWPVSSLTCTDSYSSVHGLTAAWNEAAGAFVILYVATSSTSFRFRVTAIVVTPSGTVQKTSLVDTYGNAIWSPTQPGIACRSTTANCLVAYALDDTAGSLAWITIAVNTTTLAVTAGSISTWATNVDDIPGLSWNRDDSTYRLAKADKSSAIFSYKKSLIGSWVGTGDIYNNGGGLSQISGAALSARPHFSELSRLYGWFMIYF